VTGRTGGGGAAGGAGAATVAAVDLGASGGRVMAGRVGPGILELREAHRFPNLPVRIGGTLHWDILGLYREVVDGLRAAADGCELASAGIDSWGVDYGLIDSGGALLGQAPVEVAQVAQELRGALLKVYASKDLAIELAVAPGAQFVGEYVDPFVFAQGGIVGMHAGPGEQFGDDFFVDVGVLPHVQPGQVKTEDVHGFP